MLQDLPARCMSVALNGLAFNLSTFAGQMVGHSPTRTANVLASTATILWPAMVNHALAARRAPRTEAVTKPADGPHRSRIACCVLGERDRSKISRTER
jgi:hypothetical protein